MDEPFRSKSSATTVAPVGAHLVGAQQSEL
jgi:hypothetical protein